MAASGRVFISTAEEIEKVIEMEWTPEAVKAEMDYRLESARQHARVRKLRQAHGRQPSWWRRLRHN